ncbi:hypothetical protein [Deinococcus yavapaiensis]|uniref:Copper amine oxidase-like protein n=1 Tax=Deinococcus yavapaiensis KR-236 TaxID=694435 RepID=A0A318SA08_9DEIO|nr:hypothetical protein [Deinococcus yavapaiensis]PYE53912.1 hypothetical protein DES52_107170 [Deinococcus yavapaiensis KR-236]
MKKITLLVSALLVPALLGTVALAASPTYSVIVNGQVAPDQAIVIGGKTYVPLTALKLLGVSSSLKGSTLTLGAQNAAAIAPGGANQRASLEGCVGETLFNGVWRMTVRKVEAIGPDVGLGPGWGVTVELRNGTTTKTNLHDTGLENIDLSLPNGNTLTFEERTAEEGFIYKELAQASGVTYQLRFHVQDTRAPASSVPRPAKLTIQLNPARLTAGYLIAGKVAYTTPTPSFRVRLDCQK